MGPILKLSYEPYHIPLHGNWVNWCFSWFNDFHPGSKAVPESMWFTQLWLTINTRCLATHWWLSPLSPCHAIHLQVQNCRHISRSWKRYQIPNRAGDTIVFSLWCSMESKRHLPCPIGSKSTDQTRASDSSGQPLWPSTNGNVPCYTGWAIKCHIGVISAQTGQNLYDQPQVKCHLWLLNWGHLTWI